MPELESTESANKREAGMRTVKNGQQEEEEVKGSRKDMAEVKAMALTESVGDASSKSTDGAKIHVSVLQL